MLDWVLQPHFGDATKLGDYTCMRQDGVYHPVPCPVKNHKPNWPPKRNKYLSPDQAPTPVPNKPALPLGKASSISFVPKETLRRLLPDMLMSLFLFLNETETNVTQNRWLCVNPKTPYYIGLGANVSLVQSKEKSQSFSANEAQ